MHSKISKSNNQNIQHKSITLLLIPQSFSHLPNHPQLHLSLLPTYPLLLPAPPPHFKLLFLQGTNLYLLSKVLQILHNHPWIPLHHVLTRKLGYGQGLFGDFVSSIHIVVQFWCCRGMLRRDHDVEVNSGDLDHVDWRGVGGFGEWGLFGGEG